MRRDFDSHTLQLSTIMPFPSAHAGRYDEAAALRDGMLDSEGYFTQSDEEFLTDLGVFDTDFMPPRA